MNHFIRKFTQTQELLLDTNVFPELTGFCMNAPVNILRICKSVSILINEGHFEDLPLRSLLI